MRRVIAATVAVASFTATVLAVPPSAGATDSARVVTRAVIENELVRLTVHSPSMNRDLTVDVLPGAGDEPGPTLYLLDGSEARDDESGWTAMTDVRALASSSTATVVMPVGGPHQYYTDWQRPDPVLGVVKWETFLTEELPPLVETEFHGNGVNAIAGTSMGGHAALTLAARHPALYRGVAAFSACGAAADPAYQALVRVDVARGGANADNMWGPLGDPGWSEHDAALLAANLRGTSIYLSAGSGVPGPYNDVVRDPLATTLRGSLGEVGARACTEAFAASLDALSIPATLVVRPVGTHKWGYWNDELRASWPMLMSSLGL